MNLHMQYLVRSIKVELVLTSVELHIKLVSCMLYANWVMSMWLHCMIALHNLFEMGKRVIYIQN